MAYEERPNAARGFPRRSPPASSSGSHGEPGPWAVTAYGIAVKNGYRGTEREFRMTLTGTDGIHELPMLLVTEADEEDVPEEYEAIMHPSSSEYAYETDRNEFRAADEAVPIPDGLDLTGRILKLTCGGEPLGRGAELPTTDLPAVTAADNGKIMTVVGGAWAAAAL